ncbi:hypothetical protein DMNBHIDG_02396 [Candidatus Methanoperedenaceae archaeon GB37]|nr:hypothetical protein DMNBHIDG_02396 [Candidatus Methanoperedenaceae archaeon GB37]
MANCFVGGFFTRFSSGNYLPKRPCHRTVEGYIKSETGVYPDFHKWIKIMNIVDLRGQYKPRPWLSFYGHIYKWWDFAYNQEDAYAPAHQAMYTNRETWQGISWVREVYVDFFSEYLDIRAGKQLITWGTADGIRVLDKYVNPLDWREFTLKPWNEIKIPLWTLKIEFQPTVNGSLQFLLIPDFEPDYWPAVGAPFAIGTSKEGAKMMDALLNFSRTGMAGVPFDYRIISHEGRPGEKWGNSKFGVRWRDVLGSFEYTLNYIYSWETESPERVTTVDTSTMDPQKFQELAMRMHMSPTELQNFLHSQGIAPPGSTFYFTKKYHRINVWGGTFSKTFVSGFLKGLTLRGEFAYVRNDYRTYRTKDGKFKWAKTDCYNYVIGLDKYIVTNWLASFQFIQLINSKKDIDGQPFVWPSGGAMDKVETLLTLRVSTDFFHERLKPNILIVYGDDNDWRISPSFYFEWGDHLTTTVGAHILEGKESGLHGQFNDSKELYFEVKYSF